MPPVAGASLYEIVAPIGGIGEVHNLRFEQRVSDSAPTRRFELNWLSGVKR